MWYLTNSYKQCAITALGFGASGYISTVMSKLWGNDSIVLSKIILRMLITQLISKWMQVSDLISDDTLKIVVEFYPI